MGPHFIQILKACGLSAGCSFLSQEAKLCACLGGAELGGPTFPNARVKASGLTAESSALTSSSGNKTDIQQTAQPAEGPGPTCSESLLTTHTGQQTKALLCPLSPLPIGGLGPCGRDVVCAPPLLPPWGHLPALRAHTPDACRQIPVHQLHLACLVATLTSAAAASSCPCLGRPAVSWAHVSVRGWRGHRTAWIHV